MRSLSFFCLLGFVLPLLAEPRKAFRHTIITRINGNRNHSANSQYTLLRPFAFRYSMNS
jgi:hypothetical protein